jgi:hypothetical protein
MPILSKVCELVVNLELPTDVQPTELAQSLSASALLAEAKPTAEEPVKDSRAAWAESRAQANAARQAEFFEHYRNAERDRIEHAAQEHAARLAAVAKSQGATVGTEPAAEAHRPNETYDEAMLIHERAVAFALELRDKAEHQHAEGADDGRASVIAHALIGELENLGAAINKMDGRAPVSCLPAPPPTLRGDYPIPAELLPAFVLYEKLVARAETMSVEEIGANLGSDSETAMASNVRGEYTIVHQAHSRNGLSRAYALDTLGWIIEGAAPIPKGIA